MHRMNPRQRHINVTEYDDIIALGRKCAEKDFPNTSRKNCPDPSRLRQMASDRLKQDVKTLPIEHLLHCSPCFRDYQAMRRVARITRRIEVTAAALILMGLI